MNCGTCCAIGTCSRGAWIIGVNGVSGVASGGGDGTLTPASTACSTKLR